MAILFQEYFSCCCCCGFLLYATYTGKNYHCLYMFGIEFGFGLIFSYFGLNRGYLHNPQTPNPPPRVTHPAPLPPRTNFTDFMRFTSINLRIRMCAGQDQIRGKLAPTPHHAHPYLNCINFTEILAIYTSFFITFLFALHNMVLLNNLRT
jgi:hypothetical protein